MIVLSIIVVKGESAMRSLIKIVVLAILASMIWAPSPASAVVGPILKTLAKVVQKAAEEAGETGIKEVVGGVTAKTWETPRRPSYFLLVERMFPASDFLITHQQRGQIGRVLGGRGDEELSLIAVKVYEGKRPDDPSKVGAWVCKVLKNCEIDESRRNKGTALLSPEEFDNLNPSLFSEVIETSETPERLAMRNDLLRCVGEVMANLRLPLRTTFQKRAGEGLSYEEIAQELKVRPGTVKSRIATVRNKLRARCMGIL